MFEKMFFKLIFAIIAEHLNKDSATNVSDGLLDTINDMVGEVLPFSESYLAQAEHQEPSGTRPGPWEIFPYAFGLSSEIQERAVGKTGVSSGDVNSASTPGNIPL